MKLETIREFLKSLSIPLRDSGSSIELVNDLDRLGEGLRHFDRKSIGEFATFLERAQEYEQEGHWPESKPSIEGMVVDKPSAQLYAERLTAFLRKTVPERGPMSELVVEELDALKLSVKMPQLKDIATACGVNNPPSNTQKLIEKCFELITNRKFGDCLLEMHVELLIKARGDKSEINNQLEKVKSLNKSQISKIAKNIGIKETIKTKEDGIDKIQKELVSTTSTLTFPEEQTTTIKNMPAISSSKIESIVERLEALKSKADPEDAPIDEIDEELKSIEESLNKEEAVVAAKKFGVKWNMNSKAEAIQRIREKVFEASYIRGIVEY